MGEGSCGKAFWERSIHERRIVMNPDEIRRLRKVIDPEAEPNDESEAEAKTRLSHFVCPQAFYLATEIWQAIREIEGVKGLRLEIADCLWENQVIELPREEAGVRRERSLDR